MGPVRPSHLLSVSGAAAGTDSRALLILIS